MLKHPLFQLLNPNSSMENQTFLAPSQGEIGEALLRLCHGTEEHVESGLLARFTVCTSAGQIAHYVPRRFALWGLLVLGQKLTDYQLDAVAKGHAARIEYRDYANECYIVGVYAPSETKRFFLGLAGFYKKMWKRLVRDRQATIVRQRAEIEELLLDRDLLRSYVEHKEAFALFVEGGASL